MKKRFLLFVLSVMVLAACAEIIEELMPSVFERTFSVSQGTKTDYIVLSWTAKHKWTEEAEENEEEEEEEEIFTRYTVFRKTEELGTAAIVYVGTNISGYSDMLVDPATQYWYQVVASYGFNSEDTKWKSGYCLDLSPLKIYSTLSSAVYHDVVNAGFEMKDSRWFSFQAQKGWTYVFTVNGSGAEDAGLSLYRESIFTTSSWISEGPVSGEWSCSETGLWYLRAYCAQESGTASFQLKVIHQ
jgi:hypothetical protein